MVNNQELYKNSHFSTVKDKYVLESSHHRKTLFQQLRLFTYRRSNIWAHLKNIWHSLNCNEYIYFKRLALHSTRLHSRAHINESNVCVDATWVKSGSETVSGRFWSKIELLFWWVPVVACLIFRTLGWVGLPFWGTQKFWLVLKTEQLNVNSSCSMWARGSAVVAANLCFLFVFSKMNMTCIPSVLECNLGFYTGANK